MMSFQIKESVMSGVFGGGVSAVIAFLVARYVAPLPLNVVDISIGNGLSGFFSGLMSGFVGVYIVLRKISYSKSS